MQHHQSNTTAPDAPIVSFIITTYNLPAQWLTECIESILALSLRPTEREIILIDDGSDNSPLTQLGTLANQLLYVRQNNAGLSAARNTALLLATGRYVQFVDGDDCLITTAYEHCLDAARFTDTDVIMFDFSNTRSAADTYADQPIVSGAELMRHHNIHGSAWGYLFRRIILGQLRFTPGIYHEDEEFTPQLLLRADTVLRTSAKAYYYRKRPDSIISSRDATSTDKRLTDLLDVILRLNTRADHLPTDERLALHRRVHQLTMDYIYKVIHTDPKTLEARVQPLRQAGLYPLPARDYTTKYKWFRRVSSSPTGLALLKLIIPHTHER